MNNILPGEHDSELFMQEIIEETPETLKSILIFQVGIGIICFVLGRFENKFVKGIRKLLIAISVNFWGMFILQILMYLLVSNWGK